MLAVSINISAASAMIAGNRFIVFSCEQVNDGTERGIVQLS
jgi:hypothetical protein